VANACNCNSFVDCVGDTNCASRFACGSSGCQ
jgi:hypothetical protein